MYIQITTRCNMTCEHCCYACTNEGIDMSLVTFKAALELSEASYVSIGGGASLRLLEGKTWDNYPIAFKDRLQLA